MLCVFPSLAELQDCFAVVETDKSDKELLTFHAQNRATRTNLVGLICSQTTSNLGKTLALNLDMCSLSEQENKQDWGLCFDRISAQIESSRKSLIVQHSEFVLDSIIWPPLSSAVEEKEEGRIHHGDWVVSEVKSLSDALKALNMEDGEQEEEYDEYDENDEDRDWEVVTPPPPPPHISPAGSNRKGDGSVSAQTTGTVRNYRDALLTAKASDVETSPERKRRALLERQEELRKREWKAPTIQVAAKNVAFERQDRLYSHQIKEKGIELPSNIQYEEEESFAGSFFTSSEFNKGSVSMTRSYNQTKLRPATLEKKMARIAAKPLRDKDGKVIENNGGTQDDSDDAA